jgi:hypothetical protein
MSGLKNYQTLNNWIEKYDVNVTLARLSLQSRYGQNNLYEIYQF